MSGVEIFFMLLFIVLIVCNLIAAYIYVKSAGNRNVQNPLDMKTNTSALKTEGFNRQKYVAEKISFYGICNIETSLDEHDIYKCSYSRMGL